MTAAPVQRHAHCDEPLTSVTLTSGGWSVYDDMKMLAGARTAWPTHWTYKLLGPGDRLLYVGYTSAFLSRFAHHRANPHASGWLPEVRAVDMSRWCCQARAIDMEAGLIHLLAPIHNRQHNLDRLSGIPMKGCWRCELLTRADPDAEADSLPGGTLPADRRAPIPQTRAGMENRRKGKGL